MTRRLVAILSADAVGYSRRMAAPLLSDLPSAVEAVACAVEAQRDLALRDEALPTERRLDLRIGIHVGDVIAEGDHIAGDAGREND